MVNNDNNDHNYDIFETLVVSISGLISSINLAFWVVRFVYFHDPSPPALFVAFCVFVLFFSLLVSMFLCYMTVFTLCNIKNKNKIVPLSSTNIDMVTPLV